MSVIVAAEYKTFLKEIKERIHNDAFKAVNKELSIVETLAKNLQKEFPGIQGFSVQNLWNMRQFACLYPDPVIVQEGLAQLTWYHIITLMAKVKNEKLSPMVREIGWTQNLLIRS